VDVIRCSSSGYHTSGAGIDEYEAMVEGRLRGENQITLDKNLFQSNFVHHESHMKAPGSEPEASW
jgi:hypothetical protein